MTKERNLLLVVAVLIIILSVLLCYSHINRRYDLPVYLDESKEKIEK